MKMLPLLGALGAAASLAACTDYPPPPPAPPPTALAPPPPSPPGVEPACFYTRDIRNHTIGDDHTLYLNVADRMVYRVETSGACLGGATPTDPLVIRSPPGLQYVCRPIDLDLGIHIANITSHCIVSAIVPLTPEQVAALPPKLRP